MQKGPVPENFFLSFFLSFNMRQCTKFRQSVLLSVIYHSLSLVLFTRPSITWLLILIYITSMLSVRFFYQNTVGCTTMNKCYKKQFLSIKSRCYNERRGTLPADAAHACAWSVRLSHFD